ncbi:hypothetical protein K6V98_01105 [Collinsella sp. AGMB00827]|uniref:DUF4013 domain-containing protein n=1 Tax=Collinsella ureilytica TaxID=2869515 RepID=A0ABS7MHY2_9ACTN|nr:hypothetical protein [Collinsella urealyticum]MBY4796966.1 hypothetical protein [Collinsella urealyticum]
MNSKIVRPGVLDAGLYGFITTLIYKIALFSVSVLLLLLLVPSKLSSLAALLILGLSLVSIPLIALCQMTSALTGGVRDGLNISRAWTLLTSSNKTGHLLTATCVPAIIVFTLTLLAGFIWFMIAAAMMTASVASQANSLSMMGQSMLFYGMFGIDVSVIISSIIGTLFSMVLLWLPLVFGFFYLHTAALLISLRAVGYWMHDVKPSVVCGNPAIEA